MEILSNFSSPYCFISFIIGAMFMFVAFCIVAMSKVQEPMNKVQEPMNNVHFYVARDKVGTLCLYISKPFRGNTQFCPNIRNGVLVLTRSSFKSLGLNKKDFQNLKWEDEPVEVFLNMED